MDAHRRTGFQQGIATRLEQVGPSAAFECLHGRSAQDRMQSSPIAEREAHELGTCNRNVQPQTMCDRFLNSPDAAWHNVIGKTLSDSCACLLSSALQCRPGLVLPGVASLLHATTCSAMLHCYYVCTGSGGCVGHARLICCTDCVVSLDRPTSPRFRIYVHPLHQLPSPPRAQCEDAE